jgi:hypothetical protein
MSRNARVPPLEGVRLKQLRAAIDEGDRSGLSVPLDFDEFLSSRPRRVAVDPFTSFDEWASEADDEAYKSL